MELVSYSARRLALIIPTLLGASLVMFVLTMLIPGDPALMRLGNFATAEQKNRRQTNYQCKFKIADTPHHHDLLRISRFHRLPPETFA